MDLDGCPMRLFASRSMFLIGYAISFCWTITVALEPIGKYFSISKYFALMARLLLCIGLVNNGALLWYASLFSSKYSYLNLLNSSFKSWLKGKLLIIDSYWERFSSSKLLACTLILRLWSTLFCSCVILCSRKSRTSVLRPCLCRTFKSLFSIYFIYSNWSKR